MTLSKLKLSHSNQFNLIFFFCEEGLSSALSWNLEEFFETLNPFLFLTLFLSQPWPTQIGSRATFLKNRHFECHNLDLF
jgi:hypothetical protein